MKLIKLTVSVWSVDDECVECELILEQLENIDDEADLYGIDFVKNDDPHAARYTIICMYFTVTEYKH